MMVKRDGYYKCLANSSIGPQAHRHMKSLEAQCKCWASDVSGAASVKWEALVKSVVYKL